MWRSGLAMVRDHPLLGWARAGQARVSALRLPDALQQRRGHLHNTPLQILVERGVVGLGAWLAIFVMFFTARARSCATSRPPRSASGALVTGCIAALRRVSRRRLTEYNFGDSEVVMIAYVVMAVPFVVGRDGSPDR